MRKNILYIDEIRFLIIHLIVINHWRSNLFLVQAPLDVSSYNFWFEFTSPALAIISGYLFFYGSKEGLNYIHKIKRRFHSLVIPYLFWSVTFFIIYVGMKDFYSSVFHSTYWFKPAQTFTFQNLLKNLIRPPLGNFWYVANLILILPFNYLIYYLLKNKYLFWTVFILVVVMYGMQWDHIYFRSRFLPYYLLGAFLGSEEIAMAKVTFNKALTFLMIPILFIITTQTADLPNDNIPIILFRVIIVLFVLFCIFNMLGSNQKSWLFHYLHKYKGYSFFFFASHMFVLDIVQRLLLKMIPIRYIVNTHWGLLFLIVSFALVLIVMFGMAGILKKYTPKFFGIITGR